MNFCQGCTDLAKENERLRTALRCIQEECDNRMDTEDTDDGGTRPNIWMSLHAEIEAALG